MLFEKRSSHIDEAVTDDNVTTDGVIHETTLKGMNFNHTVWDSELV